MIRKIIEWIKRKTTNPYWIYNSGEIKLAEFEKYTPLIVSQNIQLPQFGNFIHHGNIDTIKERMEDDLREAILERIKGEIKITEKNNVLTGSLYLFKKKEK